MIDENLKVEIKVYSYHIGEICGISAIYLTDPPIEGEPTCELVKTTSKYYKVVYPNIIFHDDSLDYPKQNYKIKLDYFKNL